MPLCYIFFSLEIIALPYTCKHIAADSGRKIDYDKQSTTIFTVLNGH